MTFHLSASFAVALTLAFVRSVAWVTICPPFSNSSIPKMVKIGFAGAVALFAAGTLQHDPLPQTRRPGSHADGGPGGRRRDARVRRLSFRHRSRGGRKPDRPVLGSQSPPGRRPALVAADRDLRPVLQPGAHRVALHHGGGRHHCRRIRPVLQGGRHELPFDHYRLVGPDRDRRRRRPSSPPRWRSRRR